MVQSSDRFWFELRIKTKDVALVPKETLHLGAIERLRVGLECGVEMYISAGQTFLWDGTSEALILSRVWRAQDCERKRETGSERKTH